MRKRKVHRSGLSFRLSLEQPKTLMVLASGVLPEQSFSSSLHPSSLGPRVPEISPSPSAAAPPSAGFFPPPLPVGHRLALLPRLTDDINTAWSASANPLGGVRAKS